MSADRPSTVSLPAGIGTSGVGARLLEVWARVWPLVILLGVVALVSEAINAGGSAVWQQVVTNMLINLVIVVGLYVFVGTSGVLSFGHISFMAIGAYASGILTIPVILKKVILPSAPTFLRNHDFGTIEGTLIAAVVAAVFGLVVAVPLMRLSGVQAGIATLAVLVIVYVVIGNWYSLTRGHATLTGVPLTTTLDNSLIWSLIAIAAAFVFQESRVGLRLRASREEPIAATGVGVNIYRERTLAFVVSAFLVAVGGSLYGHYLGSLNPDAFYFQITFVTIVMLVVGGINSLSGAVVGTLVISFLTEGLRRLEGGFSIGGLNVPSRPGLQEVVLALIMLLILILRPSGLTGGNEIFWPFNKLRYRRGGEPLPTTAFAPATDPLPGTPPPTDPLPGGAKGSAPMPGGADAKQSPRTIPESPSSGTGS